MKNDCKRNNTVKGRRDTVKKTDRKGREVKTLNLYKQKDLTSQILYYMVELESQEYALGNLCLPLWGRDTVHEKARALKFQFRNVRQTACVDL